MKTDQIQFFFGRHVELDNEQLQAVTDSSLSGDIFSIT